MQDVKNTSPFEYAELINVFAEGLRLGIFTKQEVTQWADGFILRDAQPDIFFIELSLSHDKEAALEILSGAAHQMEASTSPRPLLGALYKKLVTTKEPVPDVTDALLPFNWEDELLTKTESVCLNTLVNAAELFEIGLGPAYEQLQEDTLSFLSLYQEYTIANYSHWDVLDQEIPRQLSTKHNQAPYRSRYSI
ncbi:hypothetical protein LGH70_17210 [Hymenobacter sp. BT635]|uniref:YecA family protein n=1 Tax=Hymenobacter nitidus TaxID=2880929 RepID=A0ABS8AJA3_9BACT|nr:hypothetical protein [Hymenobacter nitidus]MCB2379340.1 hypothetical protein [Hymenobacter nitidus]